MATIYWLRPSDIRAIGRAQEAKQDRVLISLDLGLSQQETVLADGKLIAQNGQALGIPTLKKEEKTCFVLDGGEFKRIRFAGSETGQVYELAETAGRPMLKVSATPFHKWDFIKRIEEDRPRGVVLDAGTGLGYTAMAASESAQRVVTVENDPHVLRMQELNPWSFPLAAKNIERVDADVCEYVKGCADASFGTIILDGGTPRSSGNFFSLENYREMRRVLKRGGTLYHYLPDHGLQHGRDFPAEVIARLRKAGFTKIVRHAKENYAVAS